MNVKKNLLMQTVYQVISLGIPLIVSPYLTRTLGAEANGIYSYTYSIVYYFVIFANLGIQKYGIRLIAQRKNNPKELSENYWSLYITHFVCSTVALIAYLLFVLCIQEYQNIFNIQTLFVVSALFDVTWLFYGLEDFKTVIARNLIIKVSEVILILAMVKTGDDLLKYTVIMGGSTLVANATVFVSSIRRIPFTKVNISNVIIHFMPLMVLFVGVLAVSIYTMFDKTLLGLLDSAESVAFYEYSDKLVRVPLQITTILGTVLMPRMSALYSDGRVGEIRNNITNSIFFITFVSAAFAFGLAAVAPVFVPLYYGKEFISCAGIITALSPIIVIMSIGDVFRTQYIVPAEKDKVLVFSLVISAAVNLLMNVALIPSLGVYGAVIGTVVSELIGMLIQMYVAVSEMKILKECFNAFPFIIFGFIIVIILRKIEVHLNQSVSTVVIMVMLGASIYLFFSGFYILVYNKEKLFVLKGKKDE